MSRLPLPLCLLALAPGALAVQDCELNGQSVNPANGYTTEGKTGIMRCRDRDSGQVVREEELRAGKFVGVVRYYRDGWLEKEFSINDKGNREGLAREFFPGGKPAHEETYRNGDTVGVSRSWHANGALKRVTARDDDGREAAFAEFNDHGQLKELRCAERPLMGKDVDDAKLCGHGVREPVMRELYSDGGAVRARVSHLAGRRVRYESLWDNGKPEQQQEIDQDCSVERSFSREGVKRRETRWLAAGNGRVKQSEQEFHESGSLVRERRWLAGELIGEKTWYLNGQAKTEDRYSKQDGRSVCESAEFHDNGKPSRQGSYLVRNGYRERPVGTHRGYDSEGRLRGESEYDANGRLTRERELDENGRVVRDDAVFEDGSRKAYAAPAR